MYGANQYGVSEYGLSNSGKRKTVQDYELNLFHQLPHGLYVNSKNSLNMAEIRVYEKTINKILHDIDKLENEIAFIDSSDIGIARMEDAYGITTNTSRPIEYRKSSVISKARGVGVITRKTVESIASAFSNGEVKVIEVEDAFIIIKFIGFKGIPPNMQDLIDTLNELLPAHLVYEFKYTYTVWDFLKDDTWNSLNTLTWNDLKVYERK